MTSLAVAHSFQNDAFRAAVATSLASGAFVDTAYYVFSRRLSNGRVGVPRTIYASSAVLKAMDPYFLSRTLDVTPWLNVVKLRFLCRTQWRVQRQTENAASSNRV